MVFMTTDFLRLNHILRDLECQIMTENCGFGQGTLQWLAAAERKS